MVKRVCIILIGFVMFFVSGCNNGDIESRKLAVDCVSEQEVLLLEMFDIFEKNNITTIVIASDSSGNIAYDNKEYNVVTEKEVDPSDKKLLRACEILNELYTGYGINDIHYWADSKIIEMRFASNSRAIFYSPDTLPEKEWGAEEIKDGFYTYMLKPMF